MTEKNIKSRIVHKHDVAANWDLAINFIPKQGELIIYDVDSTCSYERFKIGDGVTSVSNLPFASVGQNVAGKEYLLGTSTLTAGENAEIFNDYDHNRAIGTNSHAEGSLTVALGNNAHAEGHYAYADGLDSHAEGYATHAEGDYSHAEGNFTHAEGKCSHVEGNFMHAGGDYSHAEGVGYIKVYALTGDANATTYTANTVENIVVGAVARCAGTNDNFITAKVVAIDIDNKAITFDKTLAAVSLNNKSVNFYLAGITRGNYAHIEGNKTIATGRSQHVQGEYNIIDESYVEDDTNARSRYAHIVGNGLSHTERSNAHTLDWSGNAWFAGDIRIGGTSYDDAISLVPKCTTITLSKNAWSGNSNPWSQVVTVNGVTANSKLDLQPTAQQIVSLQSSEITLMLQNDGGTVTAWAIGNKPKENLTMQVLITEVVQV
jgi:hypothetical protein